MVCRSITFCHARSNEGTLSGPCRGKPTCSKYIPDSGVSRVWKSMPSCKGDSS